MSPLSELCTQRAARILLTSMAAGGFSGCGGHGGEDASLDVGMDGMLEEAETGEQDTGSPDTWAFDAGPDVGPPSPPPPPPWDPPFPLAGVGWRDSTEPLCSPYAGFPGGQGADIWADSRGVFVLTSVDNNNTFEPRSQPFADGLSVQFNDGSGWAPWFELPAEPGLIGADRLRGIRGGPVFVWSGGCPVERLFSADEGSCWFSDAYVVSVAPIGADQAVLALLEPPSVIYSDGEIYHEIAPLRRSAVLRELWADGEGVLVLLQDELLSGPLTGPLTPILGLPAQPFALWATSRDDFWIGTETGALSHFDGLAWESVETGSSDGITKLWSDGSSVYFTVSNGLRRYNADIGTETIFDFEPGALTITSMTGSRERGEVYLSLLDFDYIYFGCAPAMFIVFDGTELRRF